jgi:hypothetical protein
VADNEPRYDSAASTHALDAPISGHQEAVPECSALFPPGRFLRNVLRRRRGSLARAGDHPDRPAQGARHPCADVRRSLPRGRQLYRATDPPGLQGGGLRPDGRAGQGQEAGAARSGAGDHTRHGHGGRRPGAPRKQLHCRLPPSPARQGSGPGLCRPFHRRIPGHGARRGGMARAAAGGVAHTGAARGAAAAAGGAERFGTPAGGGVFLRRDAAGGVDLRLRLRRAAAAGAVQRGGVGRVWAGRPSLGHSRRRRHPALSARNPAQQPGSSRPAGLLPAARGVGARPRFRHQPGADRPAVRQRPLDHPAGHHRRNRQRRRRPLAEELVAAPFGLARRNHWAPRRGRRTVARDPGARRAAPAAARHLRPGTPAEPADARHGHGARLWLP